MLGFKDIAGREGLQDVFTERTEGTPSCFFLQKGQPWERGCWDLTLRAACRDQGHRHSIQCSWEMQTRVRVRQGLEAKECVTISCRLREPLMRHICWSRRHPSIPRGKPATNSPQTRRPSTGQGPLLSYHNAKILVRWDQTLGQKRRYGGESSTGAEMYTLCCIWKFITVEEGKTRGLGMGEGSGSWWSENRRELSLVE